MRRKNGSASSPDTAKRSAAMSKGVSAPVEPKRDTMLKPDQHSTTMPAAIRPFVWSGSGERGAGVADMAQPEWPKRVGGVSGILHQIGAAKQQTDFVRYSQKNARTCRAFCSGSANFSLEDLIT